MKTFYFYGASDDLIVVEGAEDHEHNVVGTQAGSFTLTLPDNRGCRIHIRWLLHGCWSAGVSPLDEDIEVPPTWTLAVGQSRSGRAPSYSAVLIASVDDEATLAWEGDQ